MADAAGSQSDRPLDALTLLDGLASTRAIRRYLPDPIPEADLSTILWHATRAPSGSNRQGFRFIVLRDGERAVVAKRLLGDAFRANWAAKRSHDAYEAGTGVDPSSPKARTAAAMQHYVDHVEAVPAVVLACLVRHRAPHHTEGSSIYPACQNLLLAARALGYGGVMTMWHLSVEAELRALLGIPDDVAMSACITLGRPQGSHGPVRRRPVGDVVYDDAWEQPATWAVDEPGSRHTRWR